MTAPCRYRVWLAVACVLLLAGCGGGLFGLAPPARKAVDLSYRADAGPAGGLSVEALAPHLAGSYVHVSIIDARDLGAGREGKREPGIVTGASGAIVDPRGFVVTAAHIAISLELEARITTIDGRIHRAVIYAIAPDRELALIKMDPFPGMQVARLGDSRELKAEDPVLSIGTPNKSKGVVFTGRVTNPRRAKRIQYGRFGYDDAIELELDAEPGLSGGPLFNGAGELVGIVASFSLGNTNPRQFKPTRLAWAVSSNAIAAYLREVARR